MTASLVAFFSNSRHQYIDIYIKRIYTLRAIDVDAVYRRRELLEREVIQYHCRNKLWRYTRYGVRVDPGITGMNERII